MHNELFATVVGQIRCLLFGVIVAQMSLAHEPDGVDFDELVEIAERYNCPQPNESDLLAVGWEGSWRTIGESGTRNAGIYRPCFAARFDSSKQEILMGFERFGGRLLAEHNMPTQARSMAPVVKVLAFTGG